MVAAAAGRASRPSAPGKCTANAARTDVMAAETTSVGWLRNQLLTAPIKPACGLVVAINIRFWHLAAIAFTAIECRPKVWRPRRARVQ